MINRPAPTSAPSSLASFLSAIVCDHIDMVHTTAMSQLHDSHLADDAAQAVFLLLLRRKDNLPPAQFLPGWLYKTTCYVAAEMRRRNLRRQRRDQEASLMSNSPDPPSHAITLEHRTAVHAAIARLPASDRTAIVLSYLQGHSTTQTAAALGTTETAVRIRLTRARERLRILLRRAGVSLSAAALIACLDASKAQAAPAWLLPQIQTLLQGAAPASHILSLVNGVLQMTLRSKLLILGTVIGLLALSTGIYIATLPDSTPPHEPLSEIAPPSTAIAAPTPAQPTTSAPAPAQTAVATRLSPKSALLGVFQKAMAGDEQACVDAFDNLDDAHATIIRRGVRGMAAYNDLARAVKEKFDLDIGPLLSTTLRMGMDGTDIEKASENITGDTAEIVISIDNGGRPGSVPLPMVKIGDQWKVSSAIFEKLNVKAMAATGDMEPILKQAAADVRAGKFTSVTQFQSTLQAVLGQPTTPTPPPTDPRSSLP